MLAKVDSAILAVHLRERNDVHVIAANFAMCELIEALNG